MVRSERDQVRLASHAIRLSAEQQRVVDGLEADFRERRRGAARARRRRWPGTGSRATRSTSSSRSWSRIGRSCGCKESLFFHAEALEDIQDKLVALPASRRRKSGPPTSRTCSGSRRKYAIPLLEYFDARRVTVRVGERRVLREGHCRVDNPGAGA